MGAAVTGVPIPPSLLVPPHLCSSSPCSADRILQHDRKITALLEEKVGLFADMLALASGCEEPSPTLAPRTLFHSDSVEGSRGEKLMHDAIREGTVAPGW